MSSGGLEVSFSKYLCIYEFIHFFFGEAHLLKLTLDTNKPIEVKMLMIGMSVTCTACFSAGQFMTLIDTHATTGQKRLKLIWENTILTVRAQYQHLRIRV